MKSRTRRGVAILAILVFVAVALPLVVILMNLLATHRLFGTTQYSREITSNYANNGIQEALNLIFSSKAYLVSCDINGRVNDQYAWVDISRDFDYLAGYWIRWPYVHSAGQAASNLPTNTLDTDLAATSLTVYPWLVYRDDDADCVPDSLTYSQSTLGPPENFRLVISFAPLGRRNVLSPEIPQAAGGIGYPGDFFWGASGTGSLVRLQATTAITDTLFASIRSWLTDPRLLPFEWAYSGQLNPNGNDRYNPYRRTSPYDPILPAEGLAVPAANLGYLDNTTGRLITPALGGRSSFDPATDGIPAGFEVSISDEGARLPIYDWFHNPDDALFYNPFDYGTPPAPFNSILSDFPQTNLLADGWAQQVRSLGYLADGIGINPGSRYSVARALITHIGYYDIGDQGRPIDRDYPNGTRDDLDGNGVVDEPMSRFPSSIKQVLDANRILSEPPTDSNSYRRISTQTFESLKSHITGVEAPQNAYQDIEDPLLRRAYEIQGSGISTKYPLWEPWLGWPVASASGCPPQTETEPNDTAGTADSAGILCLHDGTVRKIGNCQAGSDCEDWWTFTTPVGRTINIFLVAPDPNPNADIRLTLEGPLGNVLGTVTAPGNNGQATLSNISLTPGITYYIRIEPLTTPPAQTRNYRFVIQNPGQTFCPTIYARPQDCLISDTNPLSLAEYAAFNALSGNWRDPAALYPFWLRTVLNQDFNGNLTGDVQERYNKLTNYFTPLTSAVFADLLARRHVGHWGAWQYFYRYSDPTDVCFGIGQSRVEEHARYHGIGDALIPVPTTGPWYDPGNVLNNASCSPGGTGNIGDWPPMYAPVDIDGDGIFDPANGSNPYFCAAGRDCMQPLFTTAGGVGNLGLDAVYEIPNRLPSPVTYDPVRQRLSDESLLFELAAGVLEGASPYLTYFDSNARSLEGDGQGLEPNPVNEICDPQGLRADAPSGVTSFVPPLPAGRYNPADGRSSGNIYADPYTGALVSMSQLCTYSPDRWPDQTADRDRPLRYRLRININTATLPVLAALSAKFSNAGGSVSPARTSRFAQSVLMYREWFYRFPGIPMNRTEHGIMGGDTSRAPLGWLSNTPFGSVSTLNLYRVTDNTSSLLTSYLFNVLSDPSLNQQPLLSVFDWNNPAVDPYIHARLAFPNDRINPPFRNIGQLFDVRYVTNRTMDPRDIDETIGTCRVLNINQQNCDAVQVPGRASEAARFFARIDQDIAVKSYAYRIESFGRLGENVREKAIILSRSLASGELEWQQQDLTPIATKYY
ncbi:MAG: hypothetical protein V2G51_01255 [bacterium JZ-2024 1]